MWTAIQYQAARQAADARGVVPGAGASISKVCWVMAIDDLPLPVVNLLNVIGVPWPYIDEQTVWDFASLVREFRQAVITTHQDATRSLQRIAEEHEGASTQVMLSGWANLSATHVDEISDTCTVLADALDAAAGYIVAQKVAAIADLAELAAAFFADQAAAFVTFGASEAAVPLIEAAAQKLVKSLEMDLQQYIAGMVIEAALKPLLAKIKSALSGLDWSQSGGKAGPSAGVSVNPAAVYAQASMLRSQGDALRAEASDLAGQIRGLKF
jgi:hypothetical protein